MIVIGFDISEKKDQSRVWRALFSRIAEDFGGIAAPEVYKDENNKPRADGVPFSVSHSGDVVMCAAYFDRRVDLPHIAPGACVSLDGEARFFALSCDLCVDLGADLELISSRRSEARLNAIAERFFTPDESELVRSEGKEAFYRIWTQKESFLKLSGAGLSRIRAASVLSLPERFHTTSFTVRQGESVFSAAVCFESK